MSTPSGSIAVSAAPISLPSSIVPVVSTVTCVKIGMCRPACAIARREPDTAALSCNRSWQVSTRIASAPPSSMPSAASGTRRGCSAYSVCPSVGSLVPGPIEPSTYRLRSDVLISSATARAIAVPFSDRSRIRSRDVVVAEVGQVAAERVGLHRVGTGLEVRPVDVLEHVGAGLVEDLVATLETAEVVERQIRGLNMVPIAPSPTTTRSDRVAKQVGVVVTTGGGGHANRVVGLAKFGRLSQDARAVKTRSTLNCMTPSNATGGLELPELHDAVVRGGVRGLERRR